MLKSLIIENIILIERVDINFHSGLNILSGETGSGKSAIMHSLGLVLGDKADTTIIRKGCEKGIVEATFHTSRAEMTTLLDNAGIHTDSDHQLIIRREITQSGKNRLFINHQNAQLSLLRAVGALLIQMIGQHANQRLFETDFHRYVVDLYGDALPLQKQFKIIYEEETQIRWQIDQLVQQESNRIRELDSFKRELEELEEASLKCGEDEELFTEYTKLFHSEELSTKIREITQALSGDRQSMLLQLNRHKQTLETLSQLDSSLTDPTESLRNIYIELQEISHTLNHYQEKIYHDPDRLYQVNERLTLINKLKRKYGSSIPDVLEYQLNIQKKCIQLENCDQEIEELKEQLKVIEKQVNDWAFQLTNHRTHHARELSKKITYEIQELNMHKASFEIQVDKQKRTLTGDDHIEFYMQPNVGEHRIKLTQGASGGEISRVLLAIQTLLAGKECTNTLIFDEVDANIGGETAKIVGDKLKDISRSHQVICITHFPQVAIQADHHLQISKVEKEGRTVTLVEELDVVSKKKELARMSGKSLRPTLA